MTSYFPFQNRKSLIEKCITNAFRETWSEKDKEIRDEQKRIDEQGATSVFAYEKFNLNRVNQTFVIPESDAFNRSVLLWKNMHDVSPSSFLLNTESSQKTIKPYSFSFRNSHFNVSQIAHKMSLRQVITMMHSFFTSNDNMLYGVLLHDGKKFLNPLHPINAQALVRKYSLEKNKEKHSDLDSEMYKVMIYTYNEPFSNYDKNLVDDSMNSVFTTHLLTVLGMLELKSQYAEKITSILTLSQTIGTSNFNQSDVYTYSRFVYETDIVNTSEDGSLVQDFHIQPVQLINSGIVSPYYGIVAEKTSRNHGTIGYQLSPMMSCNIGFPFTCIKPKGEVEVPGGNVCTGDYSNTSEEGRLTLNHANLASPFFSSTMAAGSYQFANISIRMALGIYSEFFGLPKIDVMVALPPKPPVSFDEFKRNNPNAKFSDYIQAIKK